MGQYFQWSSPVADAGWDKFLVKRAATEGGVYSTIDTIDAKDAQDEWVTGYWDENGGTNSFYKVQAQNTVSGVLGGDSDPIGSTTYSPIYTTPQKIAALMQIDQRGGDTRPDIYEVLELITWAEDEIDQETSHAWRERYSKSVSGSQTSSPDWEYHDIGTAYRRRAGYPIFLGHRVIKDFDSSEGDALEVWNGNSYVDYLVDKTEGRNKDWWTDNTNGTLYLIDVTSVNRAFPVRTKYRYGEVAVPGDIKKLASMMVAVDIATSSDRSYAVPSGGDTIRMESKISTWRKKIAKIMANRTELKTAGL